MSEHIPVIAGAVRIPTGKFLGSLASFTAPQLGAIVIKEVVRRSGISPESIDEVIMGNVVSAGIGQAPARQAAIHAGLPDDLPAFTVNKVCGSGLKAVMLAAQAIRAGDAQAFVAGGMESMSNSPYLLTKMRRSEEHTSELQSLAYLVCRLLLEKKKNYSTNEAFTGI